MNTRRFGLHGEGIAARFVEELGFEILERNYNTRSGEVDIVGRRSDVLVFFEVKSRQAAGIEDLEYLMTPRKQQRIIRTAKHFLMTRREYSGCCIRFDVILVDLGDGAVTHIPSAFEE